MKRAIPILVILFVFSSSPLADVNGSIEFLGDIEVLNLWGSWQEMGYAHGYLKAEEIMLLYEYYMPELAGGLQNVEQLRQLFLACYTVPEDFQIYAQGIVSGMEDTPTGTYSEVFGRNLDETDVFVAASVPDFSGVSDIHALFCSSVSSWGSATSGDTTMAGCAGISRNLDYYVDTQSYLLENQLLITYDPDSCQEWTSMGFPGFIGCLTGMNQSGTAAGLNMGNYKGVSSWSPAFVPICMALARGLYEEDYNESGSHDIQDVIDACTDYNRSSSYIVHIITREELSASDPALVVELNNHAGWTVRYASDEPTIAPDHIIATNHHRELYPPVQCWRYALLLDELETQPAVDMERLWSFMGDVGFVPSPGSGGTIQTALYVPEEELMCLAFSSPDSASFQQAPEWIYWDDIFPNHQGQGIQEGISPVSFQVYPNPAGYSVLLVSDQPASGMQVTIFDRAGRRMACRVEAIQEDLFSLDVSDLPEGVYMVRLGDGAAATLLTVLR